MKLHRPQIRTKNHTAAPLRGNLGEYAMRCIIRLGSRISTEAAFPRMPQGRPVIEINTPYACHNSGDKILMKQKFDEVEVKTADWEVLSNISDIDGRDWDIFPAIIKHRNSCKGEGIYFVESAEDLAIKMTELRPNSSYIIERYMGFQKEYRLHVTKDGCFYTCRKMLKADAEERWHRHDTNSVWIMEENPLFEKPKNWDAVIAECVKALNAVGLTIGACDVKIQSEKGRGADFTPDFIVLEINSAASLGMVTLEKYLQKLPEIIKDKITNYGRA